MKSRRYTALDHGIMILDSILGNLSESPVARVKRPNPANNYPESELSENEKQHISALMRVNHAGEIAAQALYKAQALTARDEELKKTMQQSADEEIDHLDWCESRIKELGDHTSYLEPVWYAGSFGIGVLAGCFGDKWNLGFLAETEHQVVRHIDSHLKQLPQQDDRSRAILEQMREDELHHAVTAEHAGAEILPKSIKRLMNLTSKVMTKTAYKI
ncbi:MAG: 2-polyprenyl-3-methyl-6-methoxy-1,4-benzoquinone monooxygenase [Proteobacteria bacterium]|nr:2-polyprenyl-3-methyl-6-methoxy-1,4-benzoquinone monooxygenase [Pseudomonadota bacterium]NOG59901.1 2-polyprenyl-3-methyl-6-methoxy-1,4-benzoquinone monooxygenase [Pseudomonadota bacterium]